ncbi:5091_t:CDS:2 [Funneliformis geosporum]|uniref:13062_t:CDS:1 n=1 Tax=Funneliformis geosporum TaxID=1117311 RepID=A0A9W4X0A3_9GLOM|nr:13062_t:CDS:2 [Funneliformis geosporum]CAI2194108.1 5091_t:CDS:2 [Funneliformis geosporum]
MSSIASSSTANVKAEINRLVKDENEKAILLAHFTKYKDQKDDASVDLNDLVTDEAKLEFLRAFLPGGNQEQESLKRHIEKVVKEEVSELRREVKKVRYFAEAWLSLPGIDTETDKGKRVMDKGTVMNFPLQLTQIRRRNSHGKFQKPPNLSGAKPSEDEIQEYFMDECTALKALPEIQLYVEDTHSTPLLNTRKPDFVFIQKGRPLDPLNVVAVGEIRKRTGNNFKSADIGHAVAFGEKVLQLQPRRQYVYAVLTDCIIIRIYRITREDNNQFSYRYTASESLTYNASEPPKGWKYLVTIMQNSPDQLGWVEPSINLDGNTVTLVRSISSGRTSIVYEGILEDRESSVVVKKAKREEYLPCFINEKDVLIKLSVLNSPYLPKLLLSNDDTLVMTPLCTKVNNLQIKDIENIIETLKTVHSNFQLVHVDLRKYNFLRDDDGNILITDWGYSKAQGENAPFAGALECMPDNVLRSLINDEQINYGPTIDLICLVRSLYLMLHQPSSIERISFEMIPENFKRRVQDILDFWAVNGKSEWWDIISSDARDLDYDKLLEDIKKLF